MVQVARTVQLHTSPDQRILVVSLLPQIYFWADRPMSGLLNGYAGIFAQDSWRRRTWKPCNGSLDLVVADGQFLRGNADSLFQKFNPELYGWLKQHYRRVVAECGTLVVYARAP